MADLRFFPDRVEAGRYVVEDAETGVILATTTFYEPAAMLSAFLNGDTGEAQAQRLAYLARADNPGAAMRRRPDDITP